MRLIQGNEACVLGALRAGCSFYAGYPITPSSEIMELMAAALPERAGVFLETEDELAALAAVIGASWAGAKAMTATSGPGFSLMQEHIGYAAMTETPCVIVDSQRGGPSTGMPTLPSQGDVMQARWGSHGDRAAIALTASSVLDTYEMTVEAFNLSEAHRLPVVLLLDATLSHMRENVELPEVDVVDRRRPATPRGFQPFAGPEFLAFGEGARLVVTGLTHDESGTERATDGAAGERLLRRAIAQLDGEDRGLGRHRAHRLDDADVVVLAYGITARAARAAVDALRRESVPAGLLELQTLWPFPESLVADVAARAAAILVPELNLGQLVLPVRAAAAGAARVAGLNRADGVPFRPDEIADGARALLRGAVRPRPIGRRPAVRAGG